MPRVNFSKLPHFSEAQCKILLPLEGRKLAVHGYIYNFQKMRCSAVDMGAHLCPPKRPWKEADPELEEMVDKRRQADVWREESMER